mmetsp:Transcript_22123/g.58601  ORF Transcript_22123/g.58601 Transcript_22123/m.58601 type:complete len:255 (-) Transcript_22123:1555-2319(-)
MKTSSAVPPALQPAGKISLKVPPHDCTVSNVHGMDVQGEPTTPAMKIAVPVAPYSCHPSLPRTGQCPTASSSLRHSHVGRCVVRRYLRENDVGPCRNTHLATTVGDCQVRLSCAGVRVVGVVLLRTSVEDHVPRAIGWHVVQLQSLLRNGAEIIHHDDAVAAARPVILGAALDHEHIGFLRHGKQLARVGHETLCGAISVGSHVEHRCRLTEHTTTKLSIHQTPIKRRRRIRERVVSQHLLSLQYHGNEVARRH